MPRIQSPAGPSAPMPQEDQPRIDRVTCRGRRVAGVCRRLHGDECGQVSLLLVFMILALATLAFFVFNTGDQVNQTVMAQNAADASALAGANWLAHGYNLLSANNVAASKIIALMAMLEALPPAVQLSISNAQTILPIIERYPDRLVSHRQGGDVPDAILARALVGPVRLSDCEPGSSEPCESLLQECHGCLAKLSTLSLFIERLNTHFLDRGGFPAALTRFEDGELWQVLRALQNFSNSIVALTPSMAQHRANTVGRGNWATNAALLPIVPEFPVVAGSWGDYYEPVMSGLPRNWTIASAEIIKGGYHTRLLHRQGGYFPPYERRDAIEVPGRTGRETEEEGEAPNERRGFNEGPRRWIPSSILNWVDARISRYEIMESARGPFRTYREDVVAGTWQEMRLSGFPIIFERICRATMNAVWNNVSPEIVVPRWETDWNKATQELLPQGVNCAQSAWLGTRRNAREPFGAGPEGEPPGLGPWRIDPWPSPPKNEVIGRGWREFDRSSQQTNFVWWGQYRVRTFDPSKFGAGANQYPPDGYEPPGEDDRGRPTGEPYWMFWRWRKWLYLGAMFDTDQFELVGLNRLVGDKSAYFPYHLAPNGEYAYRRQFGAFDVLGFAYRPGWGRMWGRALRNPSPLVTTAAAGDPSPVNLAYAQARVFNPTAWDLWTQDWHVKLVPATHLLQPLSQPGGVLRGLEAYAEFGSELTADNLRPITEFYARVDDSFVAAGNNH